MAATTDGGGDVAGVEAGTADGEPPAVTVAVGADAALPPDSRLVPGLCSS